MVKEETLLQFDICILPFKVCQASSSNAMAITHHTIVCIVLFRMP